MRIAYITHVDVRGTRAHVHNTLKTCEALQKAGADVHLVSMDRTPSAEEWEEIRIRHGIVTPFITDFFGRVPFAEITHRSRFRRVCAYLRLNIVFALHFWKHRKDFDVLYYRYHLLFLPAFVWRYIVRKPTVFECHYVYIHNRLPQALTSFAVHSASGVVAITDALRSYYRLKDTRSMMSPCHAAELEYVPKEPVPALRKELGLPIDATILCYTGSLGATIQGISYEVETMVDILPSLPARCISVIIGARNEKDTDDLRTRAKRLNVQDRVLIFPWTARAVVMKYLAASDVLLMPRVGVAPGSSPSKMFDYLAIGKPIVAASTPPVDEILQDGLNALLVDADHPEEWTRAVSRLLQDAELQRRLSERALQDAQRYTWATRGRRILDFINTSVV